MCYTFLIGDEDLEIHERIKTLRKDGFGTVPERFSAKLQRIKNSPALLHSYIKKMKILLSDGWYQN